MTIFYGDDAGLEIAKIAEVITRLYLPDIEIFLKRREGNSEVVALRTNDTEIDIVEIINIFFISQLLKLRQFDLNQARKNLSIDAGQFGDVINERIKFGKEKITGFDANLISDGYHTFGELYEHRYWLYLKMCYYVHYYDWSQWGEDTPYIWRSKQHSEGGMYEGYFLLGMGIKPGEQIRYHLPISMWDEVSFAKTLEYAPEYDGHTSQDVLERIKKMI